MAEPPLRFLQTEASLSAVKLERFRTIATTDLIASLCPGQPGALKTRPDGTVLDGHHRLVVLRERTIEVDALPREVLGTMPAKVFWIPGPWRGRLAILPRPRGGDWLGDETKAWHEAGIDVVVSLLEREEEVQLVLADEAAAAHEIDFKSFPIPDRGVPESHESVAALASVIVDALEKGRNVAVHCRQGIGRSAVIAGAALMAAGEPLTAALATITESRGLEVPETAEQRQWLRDFSSWLLAEPAAAAAADRLRRRLSG